MLYIELAIKAIQDEDVWVIDLAEDHGQIFKNVCHTSWFIDLATQTIKQYLDFERKQNEEGRLSDSLG